MQKYNWWLSEFCEEWEQKQISFRILKAFHLIAIAVITCHFNRASHSKFWMEWWRIIVSIRCCRSQQVTNSNYIGFCLKQSIDHCLVHRMYYRITIKVNYFITSHVWIARIHMAMKKYFMISTFKCKATPICMKGFLNVLTQSYWMVQTNTFVKNADLK